MDFNSPIFLFLFLPCFMVVYFVAGYRARLIAGVLGSLLFYAWGNLGYLPWMVGITLAAYVMGRLIDRWRGMAGGLLVFWGGVLLNIGVLVTFKLLPGNTYPLGLSYVTFQVMAYLIEAQRGLVNGETDLLRFSFYLLLFPKIPVGPIVRYSQAMEQIAILQTNPTEMADGLRRFIRGLAKKVLIADTLAKVVNPVFALPSPIVSPGIAWLVLISFAIQLYFDFSGYADMALGLARMMGLRFLENFDFPYLSISIADFWRRWHISLSTWFRDFVFYPLERHRLKWIGQPLNTVIVFVLIGLWHGFTRNLVLWGLIQAFALIFESTLVGRKLTSLPSPLRNLYALSVILFGWVFFRSPTVGFARRLLGRLLGDASGLRALPFNLTSPLPILEPTFLILLFAGLMFSMPVGRWAEQLVVRLMPDRPIFRVSAQIAYDAGMVLLLVVSVAALASSSFKPAIYGRF